MKSRGISRREFVAAMASMIAMNAITGSDAMQRTHGTVRSHFEDGDIAARLRRGYRTEPARLHFTPNGLILANHNGETILTLAASMPVFDFGDFTIGGATSFPIRWKKREIGDTVRWTREFHASPPHSATVREILEYHRDTSLIYRCAELKLEGVRALLHTVTLDEVIAQDASLTHNPGIQSHPILGNSFFCGVEYPVAPTTQVSANHVALGHAPGIWLEPGQVYRTRSAVYGLTQLGNSRQAFEEYISALRPDPINIHWNYNSWWTSPVPYSESDILKIIQEFKENLFDPYHEMTDTFCIDMGWTNSESIWQIDPSLFPEGFTGLDKALREIHSRLGIWISPSAVYGQALNLEWAKQAGFEADQYKCCLGGARYQAAFKKALTDIVENFDLGHVKFDGYVETCNDTNHGHQPGLMSAEPIAEGIIDVFLTLRTMKRDRIWMEPTCFGFDPSPWWVMYCNSVIGCFGADSPYGQSPCPNYRESYTTARDCYNLKGDAHIQIPIAAIDDLGIDHQTEDPFQNDAVTTVLRGNQFLPLYVNPSFMSPRRWEFLAALMKWARRNSKVLSETKPIYPASWKGGDLAPWVFSSSVFPREPYGYAHWKGEEGLLCLRNPWIDSATLRLSPSKDMGAPNGLENLTVSQIYPERRIVATGVQSDTRLDLMVVPYETALYEIKRQSRKSKVTHPAWIAPQLAVKVDAVHLQISKEGEEYGADYTRLLPHKGDHLKVTMNGNIRLVDSGRYEILALAEDSQPVDIPVYDFKVNGVSLEPAIISSETGWAAGGGADKEHWVWLIVPLQSNVNNINASIILAGATGKLSAWVVRRDKIPWTPLKKVTGSTIPPPEERYLGAANLCRYLSLNGNHTIVQGESPMRRINGIYLDTLKPVSATQGWGTLHFNQSVTGGPLCIHGVIYRRGLGTHAISRIIYDLDGKYSKFEAWAGPDQATMATITMEVRVDGKTAWKSGLLSHDSPAQRVDVDVRGAGRLDLIVGDGGDGIDGDHADWADAILVK